MSMYPQMKFFSDATALQQYSGSPETGSDLYLALIAPTGIQRPLIETRTKCVRNPQPYF